MKGNFVYRRLGQRVYDTRRAREWSQEDLSILCQVDRTYLGRIEQGKANPSFKTMLKISRALKLRLSELLEGV